MSRLSAWLRESGPAWVVLGVIIAATFIAFMFGIVVGSLI